MRGLELTAETPKVFCKAKRRTRVGGKVGPGQARPRRMNAEGRRRTSRAFRTWAFLSIFYPGEGASWEIQ